MILMARTNATTLPVETAVIWSEDEETDDAVAAARAAAAARRAEARRLAARRAASTPEAAWRTQQSHADDLASAFRALETLVHASDRRRRGATPADAPTARHEDGVDAPATNTARDADNRDDDAASRASSEDSWAAFY